MTGQTRHSWKTVRDVIRGKILSSTYRPGDKLPKDEDIARDLGCARTTVQRAMRDLADGGIIERRRKGGTRVRAHPVTRATFDIPITRREVEAGGGVYSYQLIRQSNAPTPTSVTVGFGLAAPIEMLRVEALHLADKRPYIYEDRWVDTRTVPEIADVDLARESANEWLVRHRPYSRCDLRFYAIRATDYIASVLNADENDALFVIERTTWLGNAPITTVRAVTRPGYQMLTQI